MSQKRGLLSYLKVMLAKFTKVTVGTKDGGKEEFVKAKENKFSRTEGLRKESGLLTN